MHSTFFEVVGRKQDRLHTPLRYWLSAAGTDADIRFLGFCLGAFRCEHSSWCTKEKHSRHYTTMLRWKQDALHRELCGSTLSYVREENDLDVQELEDDEDEDDDEVNREVARCMSPERVQSPTDSSQDSSWSPQPASPVDLNFPEEVQSWFKLLPEHSPESSISLLDQQQDDNPTDFVVPDEDPAANDHLPVFGSLFSPWMCVFDLDAACGDAAYHSDTDDGESDSSVPLPKLPLHLRPRETSWFGDIQDGIPVPNAMNHLFACLDPEYGRVMTIDEERTGLDSQFSSAPDMRMLPRPIPTNPSLTNASYRLPCQYFTNFATEHNIEAIYIPTEDAGAAASAAGGDKGAAPRRRAPQAAASMSLTPDAAAALNKKIAHKPHTGTRGEATVMNADAQELIQVKTPGADRSALKDLPALRDAPPMKREELFVMKLKLCSVIFSFDDPTADKRGKDMKRQTLLELVDYVNTPAGQKIFTEASMGDLMAMVSANVCRALPPATDDFDPEEDEPVLEPAWPHLQVAYEFFLRFIVSSEVNAKAAKKYVDQKFCLQLVELFDSEDPRERDYLKTILHRIYGKFMSHRSFIRRAISNVFYRFVYETERHNGIGELLEILGSIINGFAIPLKKEHLQFLVRALIPLHKPKCVALYHQQLSYCIIQYVEKDADTATPILNGFFKCWPWSCSGKQVMFLNELEEILELLGADQLSQVSTMLFTNLARCLDSDHFQVVERALFLWNNEHLVNSGCLSRLNAHTVLPIIYGPLYKNSSGHWNATVEGLAQNVLKMYMEYDLALYDKCTAAYFREEEDAKKRLEALASKWQEIEQAAMQQGASAIMAK